MPALATPAPGLTVDLRAFQAAARRWAQLSGKSQADVLRTAAKSTLSNPRQGSGLLQITPPSSQGATGLDGRRQGEAAIDRDLAGIFIGVKIKGVRPEQFPDVAGIHARLFAFKRPGGRVRSDRGRAAYFVDTRKLEALRKALYSRVGFLASGWTASARALGASVPAWVARHGTGRGTITMSFSAPRYGITMTCFAPANSPYQELERRIPYALQYATNNLERQIAHALGTDASQAGFTVR